MRFGITGHVVFVLSNYDPEDVEPIAKTIMDMFVPESERGIVQEVRTKEDT
ncbi:MAG: hypothetical protein ACFFEV_07220 [Candidatus Thorarchaeota archaeon]